MGSQGPEDAELEHPLIHGHELGVEGGEGHQARQEESDEPGGENP
jgi:hypothetical protein